jgi:hypothetical protein
MFIRTAGGGRKKNSRQYMENCREFPVMIQARPRCRRLEYRPVAEVLDGEVYPAYLDWGRGVLICNDVPAAPLRDVP